VDVDRGSDIPPYQQIAAQLRAAILDGTYPPRSRLPSSEGISQETGVARLTSRKALRTLIDEGLAVMRPGWGTFVRPREEWPRG
jgi:DNA-binding GntR family transcriptional regulator